MKNAYVYTYRMQRHICLHSHPSKRDKEAMPPPPLHSKQVKRQLNGDSRPSVIIETKLPFSNWGSLASGQLYLVGCSDRVMPGGGGAGLENDETEPRGLETLAQDGREDKRKINARAPAGLGGNRPHNANVCVPDLLCPWFPGLGEGCWNI